MPELPEVETVVQDLRTAGIEGLTIETVSALWPKTIETASPKQFEQQLKGQMIKSVYRRAKFIVFKLDTGYFLVHLRMTGRLDLVSQKIPIGPHVRASAILSDGRVLQFTDVRKFGRWYFYKEEPPQFMTLGPEPFSELFTIQALSEKLSLSKRQIKPFLLDQTTVAGLGNIYVDEALWQAGIHPMITAYRLTPIQIQALHVAIVDVLKKGIQNCGTTLGKTSLNYYSVGQRRGRNQDNLQVFRKTGEPCPRCGAAIQRLMVAQRSSHICVCCQMPPVN